MTVSGLPKSVSIGCHSAFWGDSNEHAAQLVRRSNAGYLVSDYLSEITMSLLVRARAKDADAGYAPDFVRSVAPLLEEIAARGMRLVTNAGGINPRACREALAAAAAERGVSLRIAVVEGDDLMPQLERVRAARPWEMFSGDPFPAAPLSMNAYLGAVPIAHALDEGAALVICGRCVDSALTLGILLHEFAWRADDYDRLAAGSLAGHVIECGTQATGGLFTDWDSVPGWDDMGLPTIECLADGSFTVSKPAGTGGLVTTATVAEQILYEIGDPVAYVLPDVVCDFRDVRLEQIGSDRVRVVGAKGRAPTPFYKVSATYLDGYRVIATLMIAGGDAGARARRTGEAIVARVRRLLRERGLMDFSETSIEVIGAEDSYGPSARAGEAREVVLKIGARHPDRKALELLAGEVAPAGVSMAQGITGAFAGRPSPAPVVRLFSFLYEKRDVAVRVDLDGRTTEVEAPLGATQACEAPAGERAIAAPAGNGEAQRGEAVWMPLRLLAHGRSGDKGDTCNVGIIARRPEYWPVIGEQLTAARVAACFAHYLRGEVTRYALPGLFAYNFVLENVLGGGGMASLRYDPQGKTFAQILLDETIAVPVALLESASVPAER